MEGRPTVRLLVKSNFSSILEIQPAMVENSSHMGSELTSKDIEADLSMTSLIHIFFPSWSMPNVFPKQSSPMISNAKKPHHCNTGESVLT